MNSKILFLGVVMWLPTLTLTGCQQEKSFPEDVLVEEKHESLPDWQEGYLDIHQISTGRGNAAFLIFPDGTTMLIDAGDLGEYTDGTQEIMKAMPNASKRPAEWIAQYVKHFSQPLKNDGSIDYAMITHFDEDHIGQNGRLAIEKEGLEYKLTGITHVGNLLNISTLIDRDYPTYNYPMASRFSGSSFLNYKQFVAARDKDGKKNEKFDVGSNTQIKLLKKANAYPLFEVRNIVGNGKIWTGNGTESKDIVPSSASSSQQLSENNCSCGVCITYGDFEYFSGGDILGVTKNPEWFDIETPVGKLLGETDVVVANHHAYSDAMCDTYIAQVKPQVYVIPVWDYYHPQPDPLKRMLSQTLYTGNRMVFAAGLVNSNRNRLGENGTKIKPAGHVVIRVYTGGQKFQVFVLNDKDETYGIVYKTDEIKSNK